VPLPEGESELQVTATDRLGHTGSATRRLVLDTQAPVVTITNPAEGSYQGASPVAVAGTVADADATVVVECAVAGAPAVTAAVAQGGFTCSVPMPEGESLLQVTATDRLQHTGTA